MVSENKSEPFEKESEKISEKTVPEDNPHDSNPDGEYDSNVSNRKTQEQPVKEKTFVSTEKHKAQLKAKAKPIVNLNDFNKQVEEEEKEDSLDFEDEQYEKTDLEIALSEYADLLESKKKIGEAKLLRKEFEFENGTLHIIIDSPVDESRYSDIKSDLLLFIRRKIKNKAVRIDVKRIELEKIKTVYTPQEKFDYLSQKNPALIELKKRLGLEFEF